MCEIDLQEHMFNVGSSWEFISTSNNVSEVVLAYADAQAADEDT